VRRAEDKKEDSFPLSAWLESVGQGDPEAGKTFEAAILRGDPISLPPDALGPCFRSGTGEYVAFDPGFDVEATRASKDGKVVRVRPDGPAAKVGLREGDILESMKAREGDAGVPVKIVVMRGEKQITMTYPPRGARGRGQIWTRRKGPRGSDAEGESERCGDPP
jgi:hypothetical protein